MRAYPSRRVSNCDRAPFVIGAKADGAACKKAFLNIERLQEGCLKRSQDSATSAAATPEQQSS